MTQRYAEYRPTAYDHAGAFLSNRQDWLVAPVGQTRDSNHLDRSNFESRPAGAGREVVTMRTRVGKTYRFDYPREFVTLPDYTAHRGQRVTVVRKLTRSDGVDPEVGAMWEIRAADGWTGHAFDDELVRP